ncbi:MAG: hypothetical protein A2Y78_13510 [Acidobacteria bacterium RBG_13_68_16]|nr:MAG: hypothetical protein A2Y78_13510 [Acidobacteria bacterium RBG_13_68_16]
MRVLPALVMLLVAGLAPAQELTVAEVVAAHRAGAPEEGILRLIRESPVVAPLAPADLAMLRAAGVPERVIEAMAVRTTPTPTPVRPDDQHLAEVVRAVNSGLPAEAVAERVRRSGRRYALTVNDLIYLKESKVADVVILALVASGAPLASLPALPPPTLMPTLVPPPPLPAPMEPITFGPLLRMTGVFRRESTGRLVLTADRLEWHDGRGSSHDESVPVVSLRAAWLAQGGRGSVGELRMRTVAGDDLTFRDADWATGGDAQVAELYRALEKRFPQLILRERAPR